MKVIVVDGHLQNKKSCLCIAMVEILVIKPHVPVIALGETRQLYFALEICTEMVTT